MKGVLGLMVGIRLLFFTWARDECSFFMVNSAFQSNETGLYLIPLDLAL